MASANKGIIERSCKTGPPSPRSLSQKNRPPDSLREIVETLELNREMVRKVQVLSKDLSPRHSYLSQKAFGQMLACGQIKSISGIDLRKCKLHSEVILMIGCQRPAN